MKKISLILISLLFCISFKVSATDSGWLKQTAGETNERGFSIKTIVDSDQGTKLITVSIPKERLKEGKDTIEEVLVIGKRAEERESPLKNVSYEWADDFENGDYGLIIKLKGDTRMPLRLRFSTDNSSINP